MTEPAPIDPQAADRRRQTTALYPSGHYWAMGAMAVQFMGSFFLGIWAGRAADESNTTLAMITGAVTAFAWFGAWALTHMARMAVGSVFFALALPGMVKRFTSSPRTMFSGPLDPRQQRQEFWLHVFATALNVVLLVTLYLLVAIALAAYSPASIGELWWRFALLAAFLSLFTWKALQLDG